MTDSFIYDFETDHPRQTSPEETSQILDEIHQEFNNGDIQVILIFVQNIFKCKYKGTTTIPNFISKKGY
jgi:hypothetical protein